MENNHHRNNDRGWRRQTRQQDFHAAREFLKLAGEKLQRLEKDLREAEGAGVLRSPAVGPLPAKGTASDPTGAAVSSYERIRMESVGAFADRRLNKARKNASALVKALEEAIEAVHGAWLDTDPDLGRDRRAKRAEAKESYGAMWTKESEEAAV